MRKREREQQRFQEKSRLLTGYIRKLASQQSKRSSIYSLDDLVQEAMIVLWKIVSKYPKVEGSQLIALYGKALRERYISLFRPKSKRDDNRDRSINLVEVVAPEAHVLPWDFYTKNLRQLERRIGRKVLRNLIKSNRQGRNFNKQKEDVMKQL